ncbi:MAG: protein kinase [Deltaproteobacteria bacterium]|nr:protein kinase [Deltaproteobacteria bacterium]
MSVIGRDIIGQIVAGKFRILSQIGTGGMGQVYLAEHVELKSKFAVKVLHSSLARNTEVVGRFRREARAASRIQHRNIVFVTDFGTLPDGRLYLVMEHLDGRSLQDVLDEGGRLDQKEAIDLLIQVADGMRYAHAHNVVHRDLKPGNIMLVNTGTEDGVVKIIDFGLAKVIDEGASHLTATGAVFGTPANMAPEQTMGVELDHRADIYSFGTIAYECLTGEPIFVSEIVIEILLAHRRQVPILPSSRCPKAHFLPQMDAMVMRCVRKKPEDRYQDFGEVLADLQECAQLLRQRNSSVDHGRVRTQIWGGVGKKETERLENRRSSLFSESNGGAASVAKMAAGYPRGRPAEGSVDDRSLVQDSEQLLAAVVADPHGASGLGVGLDSGDWEGDPLESEPPTTIRALKRRKQSADVLWQAPTVAAMDPTKSSLLDLDLLEESFAGLDVSLSATSGPDPWATMPEAGEILFDLVADLAHCEVGQTMGLQSVFSDMEAARKHHERLEAELRDEEANLVELEDELASYVASLKRQILEGSVARALIRERGDVPRAQKELDELEQQVSSARKELARRQREMSGAMVVSRDRIGRLKREFEESRQALAMQYHSSFVVVSRVIQDVADQGVKRKYEMVLSTLHA